MSRCGVFCLGAVCEFALENVSASKNQHSCQIICEVEGKALSSSALMVHPAITGRVGLRLPVPLSYLGHRAVQLILLGSLLSI